MAQAILTKGFLKLADAFKLCSPNVTYKPFHARRKLLQMPLSIVGAGSHKEGTFCLYLLKQLRPANLHIVQTLMEEACKHKQIHQAMGRKEVEKLLNLAESESEKERLKYAITKSSGISNTKAIGVYGFSNLTEKRIKVEQAMEQACAIKDAIENVAKIKEKAVLESLGLFEPSESDESTDEENSASETDTECSVNESEDSMDGFSSDEITSDSGSSEAEIWARGVTSVLDKQGKLLIKKKRAAIRRKCVRQTKKRLAEARLMKRKRSKKVGKIISECPGIGNEIEQFVKQCGVGADAWRRTGILTFDGNRKVKKKATFRRIKEHLEDKYGRKISYGSVVQLCCARNKRRRSAARYHGIAKVVSKRARKGFTIRYNPDQHWSSSLYGALDKLQHEDGCNIVNIGRDDQAGFRLDTMATNKQHATLCVKGSEHLTTRTDYVNKYASTLQTTSYNFPSTKTTGEICAGVVKAPGLFEKNPAQHYADLKMLEQQEEISPAFINPVTGKRKEIECVRVDGSYDEGPSHLEVQYWWTVRHLKSKSRVLLVTSRNSGASYRNRVELQNGCLALAHANLFIPSTLNGSCMNSGGKVDEKLLHDNLNSAIDVYLSRVDKAPCAGTEIHLFRGADSSAYQQSNQLLSTFLKGRKKEKKALEINHPQEVKQMNEIWDLRERHMRQDVCQKYIFCLTCCYQKNCIHPLCQQGPQSEECKWYPDGPPVSFIPVPAPDPVRRYGRNDCKDCGGQCSGHYRKVDDLWQVISKGNNGDVNIHHEPPSKVILEEFNQCHEIPDERTLQKTAEKVLLLRDETEMWFQHLKNVHENRQKGVAKAAETRKAKRLHQKQSERDHKKGKKRRKAKQNKRQEEEDVDEDDEEDIDGLDGEKEGDEEVEDRKKEDGEDDAELCSTCKGVVPSLSSGECVDTDVDWICCDGCTSWHHMVCVGVLAADVPSYWQCLNCVESWEF